jgi:biopolymer transport protein ExbD
MRTRLSSRLGTAIRTESGAGRRRLIDLTPLIDMVFILLVFFMLSATASSWDAILLGPPVRASDQTIGPPALLVDIGKDGGMTLDRKPATAEALPGLLRTALQTAAGRPVVVRPERGVPLQRIVTLLDTLSGLPVKNVSLMRAPEGAKP